jgi:hypothetical protein
MSPYLKATILGVLLGNAVICGNTFAAEPVDRSIARESEPRDDHGGRAIRLLS